MNKGSRCSKQKMPPACGGQHFFAEREGLECIILIDAETMSNLRDLLRCQKAKIEELEIKLRGLEKDIAKDKNPSNFLCVVKDFSFEVNKRREAAFQS